MPDPGRPSSDERDVHSTRYLRAAARVEFQAEELYREVANHLFHAPVIRDTFSRLAREEGEHAMRLGLLERNQTRLPWSAPAMDQMHADLQVMAAEFAGLRKEFARASAPRDPYVMLRRLAEMEDRFSSVHAEILVGDADPRVQNLFLTMARQDAEHARLIRWVKKSVAA